MEKGGLPSQDGEELLPQVKEFKYLRVHTYGQIVYCGKESCEGRVAGLLVDL